MKTSLVIPIAAFAIFIIAEISCEETCMQFNDRCYENSDCCSNNCYFSQYVNRRVCISPKNATYGVKVQTGWCSYNQSFHNDSSDDTFKLIGINAAHAVLSVGSEIELTNLNTNKSIDVIINTYLQPNNETLLQLSKEAAEVLGVEDGGRIPCSIHLYENEPNFFSIKKVAGLSASFFVVLFVVMSFL
jgi:hypothetical protein